ncbi:MAG TPA: TldD/PmbA family protein [Actinomycetota bacterium]|nr:TldD/PmbA family protein [Actinomycetota bacterium]
MTDLLDIARSVVARATRDEHVEAFLTHEKTFEARAFGGAVESVSSAEPRGAGIRVVDHERVGFSYTTDLTEHGLQVAIDRARDNSRYATADASVGLASPWDAPPAEVHGLTDSSLSCATAEAKVEFVVALERATHAIDPRIRTVEDAVYSDSESVVAIATSTGIEGTYARTDAWAYAVAIAEDAGDTQVGFDFGLARGVATLDADEIARRAAQRALSVLGASKIPSGRLPVIFDPYTAGQFLGVIAGALTGEAVQKGRSLFAGKLGEQVAGSVTLIDDGRIDGAPGSSPWDDEGTPTRRTAVIEDGVLTSLLYDLVSGARDGTSSTGNASRAGFKSPPGPRASNMALDATGQTRAQLLESVDRGLLVQDFHGVHSGANAVTGDFSVGATGRLVEKGALAQPVKEVTIALPMLDILSGIEAVADDRRWLPFGGSFGGATTVIAEMTVAGT